jgi:DNA invertase Pin-like site-specific DNA recombinase
MSKPPLKVIGYIRVSTVEQAKDGVSLSSQADKIRQYSILHELDLVDVVEDAGVSAKSLDRPGLQSCLARLDAGEVHGILVAKLDRLTRSVVDLGELVVRFFGGEDPRGQLLSVADSIDTRTATGRLILNFVVMFAQWEREVIVERTQEAMDHKRANGERLGTIPYGKRIDAADPRISKSKRPVALIESSDELSAIAIMISLGAKGWSYSAIAEELDRRGIRPRKSAKWAKSSIAEILGRVKEAL